MYRPRLPTPARPRTERFGTAAALALGLLSAAPAFAETVELVAADDDPNIVLIDAPPYPRAHAALYLEVYLNQVRTRRVIAVARTADGQLHAWSPHLREIGLLIDVGSGDRYLALATLAEVAIDFDEPNQRLLIDARPSRLNLRRQQHGRFGNLVWPATASPGALLNYDLYATLGEPAALTGGHSLRLFGGSGTFESNGQIEFTEQAGGTRYRRFDSAWTHSDPMDLSTLILGDYSGGLPLWTRRTRMAGVQWRRNFALQPGLITYPIPQFYGEAALPSTLELYVNGIRQYSGDAMPGPFQLATPPSVNGAGQARIVLTDTLGRSQSLDFDFYSTPRLLRAGIFDYAIGVGAVRQRYGIADFDYGDRLALNASYASGLRDWLTLEAHAEGDAQLQMAGVGAIVGIGALGSLRGNLAHSRDRDNANGLQSGVGYGYANGRWHVDYSLQRTSRRYADLASSAGRPPSRRAEQALLGHSFGGRANVSASYVDLDSGVDGRFRSVGLSLSAYWLQGFSPYAGISRTLGGGGDLLYYAGVSMSFDNRLAAGIGIDGGAGFRGTAYASRSLPLDGGHGWRLAALSGSGSSQSAEYAYRGDHGTSRVGAQRIDNGGYGYVGHDGSLILMDRRLFPARSAADSFALVSTDGIADIPVLLENRPIGNTDARGHYLLTNLNPYQPNRISIDPLNLPAEVRAGATVASVVPADRAGIKVDFSLERSFSALLTLVDARGEPLPLSSAARRDGHPVATVGFDGELYLEALDPQTRLAVTTPTGDRCEVHFKRPTSDAGIPRLGPLPCQ